VLADVIDILLGIKIGIAAIGFHHAQPAIVKIQGALTINRADEPGFNDPQGLDRFHVLGEHPFFSELDGKKGEIQDLPHFAQDILALFFEQRLGKSAGHPGHRVDGFVRIFIQDHFGHLACANHARGQFRIGLGDTDDIAHGIIGRWADDKIGRRKKKEMQQLVFGMGDGLHQFAQFAAGRGGCDAKAGIHSLVGSQMMHPGTDAADAADNAWDFLGGFALDELFETAQRHVAEPGIGHITVVIEGDADRGVAFDARDGLNRDDLGHWASLLFVDSLKNNEPIDNLLTDNTSTN